MIRPRMTVLPDSAQIPDRNLLYPPPNQFTHEVSADQPYYYGVPQKASRPDGTFSAGTKVVLMSVEGAVCHVADGRGLHVVTSFDGLEPLPARR